MAEEGSSDVREKESDGVGNSVFSQVIKKECKDKKLVRAGEHNVREPYDRDTCWITAAIFVPDGRCLLCDRGCGKLKLLDLDFMFISRVKLASYPCGVAMVTANECIVTMPESQTLQFVTVGAALKLGRTVGIGRPCCGVTVHNRQLFIACSNGVVVITDMEGTLQKTIGEHSALFRCPFYLAVSRTADKVYVSDLSMDAVVCTTVEGEVMYKYADSELKGPEQIVIDESENVFVCARDSNTLQVLTPDGRKYNTLLSGQDGLRKPFTFCYRSSDDTLLVGMFNSDEVYVYKFY